jgi:uncharacterized membrane protein
MLTATGRESKGASIVLSEKPGKDELKFLHQQPYCLLFFFIFLLMAFKILSINVVVLVENGIWVITKVFCLVVQFLHAHARPPRNPLL